MKKETEEKLFHKKKIGYSIIVCTVILVLLIGFSRAWFYNKMDMETLLSVKGPSDISILGPDGSEMESLNLRYTDTDEKEGDKVTIRRVICIQSAAERHKLEVVHTTNLKGLTFNLYEAKPVTTSSESSNTVTDTGLTFSYDGNKPIQGSYINEKSTDNNNYKYALGKDEQNSKHEENFGEYEMVQAHAEPLYWLVGDILSADKTNTTVMIDGEKNYRTYYICEISWTEKEEKETDMFYILAKTVFR